MSELQRSRWDLKMLLQVAVDAKRKVGGWLIAIMFDIIISSLRYDMSYKEYRIYEFCRLSPSDRKKFLMMSDARRINKRYNLGTQRELFTDKLAFSKRFGNYTKRPVIDLRVSGLSRLSDFVSEPGMYVGKRLGNDKGVSICEVDESTDLESLRAAFLKEKFYLFEPFVHQHPELETLYPECVNTLKVITFVSDDLEVVVLNQALKLGNGGVRDNFSRGGLFSVLDEDGVVIRPFVNKLGRIYEQHPITNENLLGFTLPYFDEALELCKQAALEIAGVRYVGWDVAITETGPILIDGSMETKFFQTPPSVSAFVGEAYQDLRADYKKYMDLTR